MSLLDTLPGLDELSDSEVVPHEGLLSTLDVDNLGDEAEFALEEDCGAPREEAATLPASVEPHAARRPRTRKRPAPKIASGSGADGATGPRTRSEICKAAAEARWKKKRESGPAESAPSTQCLVVVPAVPPEKLQMVLHDSSHHCSTGLILALASPVKATSNTEAEKKVWKKTKHVASTVSISQQLGISRWTVARRLRIMAGAILFGSKHRFWRAAQSIHYFLKERSVVFTPVLAAEKQRFDEFQIKVRVTDLPKGMPVSMAQGHKETITAKIMQINSGHALLWRCDDVHLAFEGSLPSCLKPIQSTHAELIKETCLNQSGSSEWAASTFAESARVAISDNHASNALSDYAIWQHKAFQILMRWICRLHIGHKISEIQWQAFPGDMKGLMGGTLAQHNPGAMSAWKKGVKQFQRWSFTRIPWGQDGPGQEVIAYNEKLACMFENAEDNRLSGPRAQARQRRRFKRKKLRNGDPRLIGETHHWCKGPPDCCATEAETLKDLDNDVEEEELPPIWVAHRWLGSEASVDWHGEWLNRNGLYIAGVLIGWFGFTDMNVVKQKMITFMQGEFREQSPDNVTYQDVTKEMSDFQKQTTYRANVLSWFGTQPVGRLWVLKCLIRVQQRHQKDVLKSSGPEWEKRQLQKVKDGERRTYRPLLALDQVHTTPCLRAYGKLLVNQEQWTGLPEEFQVHSLAMTAFRCGSRSACAMYQLEWKINESYPAKNFGPLRPEPEDSLAAGKEILADFLERPCTMDPWGFEQAKNNPTLAELMSTEMQAKRRLMAILAELENAGTEAGNAAVRRRVKMHLQQKTPDLADITADWIVKFSRMQSRSIFGRPEEDSSSSDGEDVMGGGGGGQYRGFISLKKDELKDEDNKVDFTRAAALYWEERAKEASDCLAEAAGRGKLAVKACRAAWETGESRKDTSNFGTVRERAQVRIKTQADELLLLNAYEEKQASANRVVEDGGLQLAVYQRDENRLVTDVVLANAHGDLKSQLDTLQSLCRAVARKEAAMQRIVLEKLREFVNNPPQVSNFDFATLELPELGVVKLIPEELPTLHWHDPADQWCQKKSADLKGSKIGPLVAEMFEKQCRLTLYDDCESIGYVGLGYRPTYCWKFGSGRCLCSGSGILLDIFRLKSTKLYLLLCPEKTELRRLLLEGWLFARFNGDTFFHCGLVYLNPQRVTYLRVHLEQEHADGRVLLSCQLSAKSLPETHTDVEVAASFNLEEEIRVTLYKLVSSEMPHIPFTVGTRLHAVPLDQHVAMPENNVRVWKGRPAELVDEAARRAKLAAKEATRRANARAKASAVPKAAPEPRAKGRPVQRPRNAGIEASDLAAGALVPIGDDAAVRPARAGERLLAPGDYDENDGAAFLAPAPGEGGEAELPGGAGLAEDWHGYAGVNVAGAGPQGIRAFFSAAPASPSGIAVRRRETPGWFKVITFPTDVRIGGMINRRSP